MAATVYSNRKSGDDITELSWAHLMTFLPNEKIEAPEAIKNGEE